MKHQAQSSAKGSRRRGMALIIVIGALALATMLLLAMFSLTESEYRATQSYVTALSAKQFADTATAIVQAQIQNGQNKPENTQPSSRIIHATQPGCVRVYNANGRFKEAFKLYSSATMRVTGESEAAIFSTEKDGQVPENWSSMPARYVDLNEPVVRPSLAATGTGSDAVSVYFPIIDPRAAFNYAGNHYTPQNPAPRGAKTTQVEGFWYSKSTPVIGASTPVQISGVKTPEDESDANKLRLPMPVEWIYILQDGTLGTLNSSNTFVSATPGVTARPENPIVARIAFWTDDETCKININTASEPTYFSPPYYYHDRDYRWANYPPVGGEYQRYPGHPATVALSSVLAPNMRLDPVRPQDDGLTLAQLLEVKEYLYNMAPKISVGGSKAGTLPFTLDEFSPIKAEGSAARYVDQAVARKERLYASVDEMIFKDGEYNVGAGANSGRVAARYPMPGDSGQVLFDTDTLERSRFFLTAHSRAPEFSMYGLPRVCMWPVADESQAPNRPSPDKLRTSFDNMIALCATLRNESTGSGGKGPRVGNSYIFRRADPHSSTYDLSGSDGLQRNSRLLTYLVKQMSELTWPQLSSLGSSSNYSDKYGTDNVNQLAVQFFDYVRCINLYDSVLARQNDGEKGYPPATGGFDPDEQRRYRQRDAIESQCYTYTNQRIAPPATNIDADPKSGKSSSEGALPGHGQVSPAAWGKYQGLGRMFTLSEVGFQFICTADGKPHEDEHRVDFSGVLSGGGSAPRIDPQQVTYAPPHAPTFLKNGNYYTGGKNNTPWNPEGQMRWYSNYPPLTIGIGFPQPAATAAGIWKNVPGAGWKYGVRTDDPQGLYHPSKHPGYRPENWNYTLEPNKELLPDERRIQAILSLEAFCPMLGWTKIHPEFEIHLSGAFLGSVKINGQALWDSVGDVVLKSNNNLYQVANVHSVGGHAGPAAFAGQRGGRPTSNKGGVMLQSDPPWTADTFKHAALSNYGLTSDFITVPRDKPMTLTFGSVPLEIKIYDKHWSSKGNGSGQPIQTIRIKFEDSEIPVPWLVQGEHDVRAYCAEAQPGGPLANQPGGVGGGEANTHVIIANTTKSYWRALQAPHWWGYHWGGALMRAEGNPRRDYDEHKDPTMNFWVEPNAPIFPLRVYTRGNNPLLQSVRGRLDTDPVAAFSIDGAAQGIELFPRESFFLGPNRVSKTLSRNYDLSLAGKPYESDVTRTMVPAAGDYRVLAALRNVPESMWMRHPLWTPQNVKMRSIHSFTNFNGSSVPGHDLPRASDPNGLKQQLVAGITFGKDATSTERTPDLPPSDDFAKAANSFGDFDTGIANAREGPYVNKPDEGNFHAQVFSRDISNTRYTRYYRSSYFFESWRQTDDWRSGIYMTPNRMISSPVMFGSLPTGVWNTGGSVPVSALTNTALDGKIPARPWQTLLFRPYVMNVQGAAGAKAQHPGNYNPRDHFLLDLFFMPVVEPYAISEPLSVAGRINMNYQIVPFTNIHRATALHALMKGEMITAIPNSHAYLSKVTKTVTVAKWDVFYNEDDDRKFWHRPINVPETLRQFDERFHLEGAGLSQGLFRSPSQICELHLIPDVSAGTSTAAVRENVSYGPESLPNLTGFRDANSRNASMTTFWQNHAATGENIRERPYSNLYSRLTTRSNTFRIHVRAQVLKKARSTDPAVFDPEKDAVLSEYRGSTLLERFIDPNNTAAPIPDYAASASSVFSNPPLDSFYEFRVLETKRFNP